MSRFVRRHLGGVGIARHALPAMLLITAVLAMMLALPNHARGGGKKDPPPPPDEQISDSTDLDGKGSFEAIIACPSGDNPNTPDPGQVLIQSDDGGLVILEGNHDEDWFGASVAIAGDINPDPQEDFNGDGYADIIIGAPREEPRGYAYVFYGPFAPGEVLDPEDADMSFYPPEEATYDFGLNVRQVADIDCDGTPDIGIGGVQPVPPGQGGGTIIVTYFASGATGDAIFVAEGNSPFNPWLEIVGDAEGDGDVDAIDIAIIDRNMGRISPRLTVRDGDFNGDGRITQADKNMALANMGADHFAPIRGCNNPCPNPPPPGFHCIEDCHGDPVLVPINIWEYCDPIMCTQGCWCGYDIYPFPNNYPDTPHQVYINQTYMIVFGADGDANWEITQGEENILVLPQSNDEMLVFWTLQYGPVTVTADYYCCASGGQCYLEVPMTITDCNDICSIGVTPAMEPPYYVGPNDVVTLELEGVSGPAWWTVISGASSINVLTETDEQFTFSVVNSFSFSSIVIRMQTSCCSETVTFYREWLDSDSDGLPNSWELLLGLNPYDADSDDDGTPDSDEDADGDGLNNHDEFIYGSDPTQGDTDGDGVNDAVEVAQGSDPNDGSDGGVAPDPNDLIHANVSIGDPSGSHSELWMLKVGDRQYKAPGFGEVKCFANEKFLRGKKYEIQLVHLGSNLQPPDLDHIAWIDIVGNSACVILDNQQGILTPLPDGLCSDEQAEYDPHRSDNILPDSFDDERAWLFLPKGEINASTVAHNEPGGALNNDLEETPGTFVPVNNDDDDYDEMNKQDRQQTGPIENESDLMRIVLHKVEPVDIGGHYTLTIPSNVRIWKTSQCTDRVYETTQLSCDQNTTLWVEGVSQGSGHILLNWKKGSTSCTNSDMIKVTTFTLTGPLNVPGYAIYQYTVSGVNGTWQPPIDGEIDGFDGPNDRYILWGEGPVVGKVVYAATSNFVWYREVNVVQVQVDTRDPGTTIDYDNPNIQLFDQPTIGSPVGLDDAIDLTLVVSNIEGPVVNNQMRGTRFIDVGFIHIGSWPAMHGKFEFEDLEQPTPFVRFNDGLENSGWHLDYVINPPEDASTPPWADSQATITALPYLLVGDLNGPINHTFTFLDVPHQKSCDDMTLDVGRDSDDIDAFELEFSLELYFAVHTTEDVNGSLDVYTQRAAATWTWNNRAPVINNDWQGDEQNFQPNNSGSVTFDEVTDGSPVPIPDGPSCNQLLIDHAEAWSTEPG